MLPASLIEEAQQALTHAADTLRAVGQGSVGSEVEAAVGMMEQARELLAEVSQLCVSIRDRVDQAVAALSGTPATQPAPTGAVRSPTVPRQVPASRIAEVMSTLPPPVDNPPPRGQPYARTHGRLLDASARLRSRSCQAATPSRQRQSRNSPCSGFRLWRWQRTSR